MSDPLTDSWSGYLRPDGRKGVRNLVLVLYTVECARHVAHAIAAGEEDVHVIGFPGCYDNAYAIRLMLALARHPNVDLEIVEGEPHELVGLWQTRVDFAVGPKDVNNGFLSKPLFRCKRVLLYSRNVQYKKTSPGRSDFADSSLRVAGLNTFACNLAGGFPGMANSEKSRFNLFGREILTVVTVRQACECQCQGHQVQKLTIFSLNVAWFGHTAFSDQLWGIRAFSETKNGPAGIPQARQGNVLDMALSCCQDGGPCIA